MRLLKKTIKRIVCVGIIFLLFPINLFSQEIKFDSFQGIAVPSPSIPDVCPPTNTYSFSAVLTNNRGAQIRNE